MSETIRDGIDLDDMFSPSAILDPYAHYGRIREIDPVRWNERHHVWVVTRFDDVVWINGHPNIFSSAIVNTTETPYPPISDADLTEWQFVRNNLSRRMTLTDPPAHTAQRAVLREFFSPAGIERWRGTVRDTMIKLLDHVEHRREMDVMRDFAVPFPLGVICELMNIPEADRPWIRSLAENLLIGPRVGENRMSEIASAMREMSDYLEPVFADRLAHPGDDLLSQVTAGEKAGIYSRDQAMQNAIQLIVAGHETTINLICNGVLAFVQHPGQWERLHENPELIDPAVEEVLRYDSPVQSIERITTQDIELNGKLIRKGERVRWFIGAANRDPRRFPQPDTFDIARSPNQHVAFGRGVHLCLGAPLARMEARLVFAEFARRFPRLNLKSSSLEYAPMADLRSLKELVVTW